MNLNFKESILTKLSCANICNCSKIKKVSFRADASFRPKCTTAWIATAWQKPWKISTARIKKSWNSGTCTAVRLKKVEKSGTCAAVRLKNRVS